MSQMTFDEFREAALNPPVEPDPIMPTFCGHQEENTICTIEIGHPGDHQHISVDEFYSGLLAGKMFPIKSENEHGR